MLLVAGTAIGAAGVVFVQERYLPPRLSADASAELQRSFETANADRMRLQAELSATAKRLDAALADKTGLADALAAARGETERLRQDVASLVAALPPDPRGGAVEVRAARFTHDGDTLGYDVVLTQRSRGGKPLTGVLQLVVAGNSARGPEQSLTLEPLDITMRSHESLRGSVPLPAGFTPRQATISVRDRPHGQQLGRRVVNVR